MNLDPGVLAADDQLQNLRAVREGRRVFSAAYELPDGTRIWIITEASFVDAYYGATARRFLLNTRAERCQAVGTVPPSMTYSVPVMEAARGDARNATKSATSLGLAGRPSGMPPSESMTIFRPPS